MKRFQVYLEEKQAEKLRQYAFRNRVSKSEVIRYALSDFFAKVAQSQQKKG